MKNILYVILVSFSFPVFSQSYEVSITIPGSTDTSGIYHLYPQCRNYREIGVTDINKNKQLRNIRLRASGANVTSKGGYFRIVPFDNQEPELSVLYRKTVIARNNFAIIPVPDPEIEFVIPVKHTILANGNVVDENDIISYRFILPQQFTRSCPDDTLFRATNITVVRNGNVKKPKTINGSFSLREFGLKPGETIKLDLNRYERINFEGKEIFSDASPEEFLILKLGE